MTAPPELVEQLSSEDAGVRARALAELVGQGSAAVPALLQALQSGDDSVRRQAAEALASIGDPQAADALAAATHDADGDVRGHASAGLARVGDPRAVEALVRTIDDLPDILHAPYTASVYALIGIGEPALAAVEPLLSSDDPLTRQRATLVVQTIRSRDG